MRTPPRLSVGLAWLCLLGCGSGPAVNGATSAEPGTGASDAPAPASEAPDRASDHEEGGWVVYRYDGAYTPQPVELREEVARVDGLELTIEVEARRGDETRRWVQVVTDTEENRRNNVVDALYEIVDGERRELPADQEHLLGLYGWTLPPCAPGEGSPDSEHRTLDVAGRTYECTCEMVPMLCEEAAAELTVCECPDFAWRHAWGEARIEGQGEPFWRVQVVDTAR